MADRVNKDFGGGLFNSPGVPSRINNPEEWLTDGISRPLPSIEYYKENNLKKSVRSNYSKAMLGAGIIRFLVSRPEKINEPLNNAKEVGHSSIKDIILTPFLRLKYKITIFKNNMPESIKGQVALIYKKTPDRLRKYGKGQIILASAGAAVFLVGIIASITSFNTNSYVTAQNDLNQSTAISGDNPSEDPPSDSGTYQVPFNHPRRITIDKLSVNALIRPLGTKSNNELLAPSNIHDAGWYKNSSKPGELGAMLIDGHVSGLTKPGIFKNLENLNSGDFITVERGDGAKFNYKVIRTQVYDVDKVDMLSAMLPVKPGIPGLNLISCTGQFDARSQTYKQRVVIFASQIDN